MPLNEWCMNLMFQYKPKRIFLKKEVGKLIKWIKEH